MTDDVPPPSLEWQTERPWDDDSLALFENLNDPLDAQLREQDKRNRIGFKKATGRIIVWSVYMLWALLAIGLLIWAWHYLTPWPFLADGQLAKVQSIIFSGTLGALVSTLAKSYMGRSE